MKMTRFFVCMVDFLCWRSSIFYRYFHGHFAEDIREIIPVPLMSVRTTRSSIHSHPFQVSLSYPRNLSHKSSFIIHPKNMQLIYGTSCLLLALLNPAIYHLLNLRSINLI